MLQWIKTRIRVRRRRLKPTKSARKAGLLKHGEEARNLVHEKLVYWNKFYGYKYNRVFIRFQTTRWGSCSSKGNLNFNCKIVLLSPAQADYLIVHELCHLGEFNHSSKFWDLVGKTIPNYKELRGEIRKVDLRLLG